jgi:hypothetical protein
MLLRFLFFCAADERLAAAKRARWHLPLRLAAAKLLRLRLDCFYTLTFTPGLGPFLTASAPARVQFLFKR